MLLPSSEFELVARRCLRESWSAESALMRLTMMRVRMFPGVIKIEGTGRAGRIGFPGFSACSAADSGLLGRREWQPTTGVWTFAWGRPRLAGLRRLRRRPAPPERGDGTEPRGGLTFSLTTTQCPSLSFRPQVLAFLRGLGASAHPPSPLSLISSHRHIYRGDAPSRSGCGWGRFHCGPWAGDPETRKLLRVIRLPERRRNTCDTQLRPGPYRTG